MSHVGTCHFDDNTTSKSLFSFNLDFNSLFRPNARRNKRLCVKPVVAVEEEALEDKRTSSERLPFSGFGGLIDVPCLLSISSSNTFLFFT